MIKALFFTIFFVLLPVPTMLLMKSLHRDFKWALGYLSGIMINLCVFVSTLKYMSKYYSGPSTLPLKITLAAVAVSGVGFVVSAIIRCCKDKKWIGISKLFYCDKDASSKTPISITMIYGVALIMFLLCAYRAIYYAPMDGVRRLADINRIDFFGLVNTDYSVMLGYYFNRLWGIPSYYLVYVVVPLTFIVAYGILCYSIADALFADDKYKKAMCFLIEMIMTLLGDCMYSHGYLALHGMVDASVVAIILAVPVIFVIGYIFFNYEGQLVTCTKKALPSDEGENKEIKSYHFDLPMYWICLLIMSITSMMIDNKSCALALLGILTWALLLVGRRYLPCLKSFK